MAGRSGFSILRLDDPDSVIYLIRFSGPMFPVRLAELIHLIRPRLAFAYTDELALASLLFGERDANQIPNHEQAEESRDNDPRSIRKLAHTTKTSAACRGEAKHGRDQHPRR